MAKLILLDRQTSYDWLNSIKDPSGEIPQLTIEEHKAITHRLKERERFKPWTHRLVDGISKLPIIKKRFPHDEFVQQVGRLESDGWFVRVYVNYLAD